MNATLQESEWDGGQIADNEPDSGRYTYRLNGSILVQAYWSISYQAFIVPNGSIQDFYLDPNWDTQISPPNFLSNFQLTVEGDQFGVMDDTVTLGQTGAGGVQVTLNGETVRFDPTSISGIDVTTQAGTNTVNIEATPSQVPLGVSLIGGIGTVNISPSAQSLDNIQDKVDIVGGDGDDVLNIYDRNSRPHKTYSITFSTVTRTGAPTITYQSLDHVNVYGSNKGATYNIASNGSGSSTLIYGGSGNDTFNVSSSDQDLTQIQGSLAIWGGDGKDSLNLNDWNHGGNATYTVTDSTITRTGAGTISYASDESVNLYGNNGLDIGTGIYDIESTAPGTTLSVVGGRGNDVFNISPTIQNLDHLQGAVHIDSVGGFDILYVFDGRTESPVTYLVNSSIVTRTGAATVSYGIFVRNLILNGGSGRNTYNIESTTAVTPVFIIGGPDNDAFNVSPTARKLDTIAAAVAIVGNGGQDSLVVHDEKGSGAATYSVTSSSVAHSGAAPIGYAGLSQVTLDGGGGNDTYNIESTAVATAVAIVAGKGKNTFNASPTAQDLGTIQGDLTVASSSSSTANALVLDDQANPVNSTYSLTSSTASRTGTATITYLSLNNLVVNGGGGNDTYNINGTAPGIKESLVASNGGDTFTVIATAASSSISVGGGSGNDTLVGPNVNSIWNINGADAGTVGKVTFAGVENLTGGSMLDAFVFGAGKSVSGQIDGGGGGDWLDYAAYATPVMVNLTAGTATGVGGGIANIANVRGGQGGNTLTGNALGNLLIGGAGTNTIVGGTGRSLLIGGKGKDTITGNSGGDILIAGYTDYDSSTLANDLALESILAEWQSAATYATRISHLKNGGGLNGPNTLTWGGTVHENALVNANTLTGGMGGQNWFFANVSHTTTNKQSGEQLN